MRRLTHRPIRVALRIAGDPVPAFIADAAERVLRVAGGEVVLILIAKPVSVRYRPHQRTRRAIEALYASLERRTLPGGPSALAPRSFNPATRGIRVVPDRAGTAGDAIRDAAVDLLVDLAPAAGGDSLPIPPQGRWRLEFADGTDGPRKARLARPTGGVALAQSLLSVELPSGERIETGAGISSLHRYGFARDRDAVYWRAARLPARRLTQLVAGDPVPSPLLDGPSAGAQEQVPQARRRAVEAPFAGLAVAVLRKGLGRLLFHSEWCVLVRERDTDETPPRDLTGFVPVEPPSGRFYADPFVVETPRGIRIYVEDSPMGLHRGRITSLRPTAGGSWSPERVVLEDLDHRAYPHVLRAEAGLVLTADSGRSGGVDVFVQNGPDTELQHVTTCLEGVPASDPTLLWHEGLYWLFVGVADHGMSPWDELHAYFAAEIAGPWQPHRLNPVVADVRSARPAGRVFRWGEDMIRPGQDCSERYGGRIVLSAITTLSPDAYDERRVGSIEPRGLPGFCRTHTYTFDGSVEALDGYRQIWRRPCRTRRRGC